MAKRIIAVAGPTASGKTALAVEIAKMVSGEVVSCDSMQIYRRMDIGTAKPNCEEMCGIPHFMIDIAEPDEEFSVAEYTQRARACIDDIIARDKIPILAGGTGLYMDSVLNNIDFADFDNDYEFRERMKKIADTEGAEVLHQRLKECDAEAAERIHPNNVRRVIRALEVFYVTGKTFTQVNAESRRTPVYDAYIIGLDVNREVLYDRINKRVDIMLEKGLLDEVKRLKSEGIGRNTTAMQAIGYKELLDYIEGKTDFEAAVEHIKQESRRYAKRQLTWFRRNQDIDWITIGETELDEVFEKCHSFLKG